MFVHGYVQLNFNPKAVIGALLLEAAHFILVNIHGDGQ